MEITIQYSGQLASLVGNSEEKLATSSGQNLLQLVQQLASTHGAGFSDLLLTEQGELRASVLVIYDGEQVEGDLPNSTFEDVKTIMFMTPIAGG